MGNMNSVREGQSKTGKGMTPNVPGLNKSAEMSPKKFSKQSGGDYYKKPKAAMSLGSHKDKSSGQSMPTKKGDDNKKRYAGTPQPEQYSNACGPQKTKFVT